MIIKGKAFTVVSKYKTKWTITYKNDQRRNQINAGKSGQRKPNTQPSGIKRRGCCRPDQPVNQKGDNDKFHILCDESMFED